MALFVSFVVHPRRLPFLTADFRPLTSRRRLTSCRSAFTLIELLVVAGIIVILAGILVVATTNMYRSALVTRTKATITILAMGLDDFKKTYSSYPYHDNTHADFNAGGVRAGQSSRIAGRLPNTEADFDIRNIYYLLVDRGCIKSNAIDPKYLAPRANTLTPAQAPDSAVLDAWGAPLAYRYPRAPQGQAAAASITTTDWSYSGFDLWSKGPDGADSRGSNTAYYIDPRLATQPENGDNLCWPFEEKR